VLESEKIQLEKTWLEQPRLCSVWVHRTVRWCTGQCPVRQAGSGEKVALGSRRRGTAINHRTVRWCTRQCSVCWLRQSRRSPEPSQQRTTIIHRTVRTLDYPVSNGRPSQRSTAQSARDAWPGQQSKGGTGLSGLHRTVSDAPTAPSLQRSSAPE
jgi:hypothetical protein